MHTLYRDMLFPPRHSWAVPEDSRAQSTNEGLVLRGQGLQAFCPPARGLARGLGRPSIPRSHVQATPAPRLHLSCGLLFIFLFCFSSLPLIPACLVFSVSCQCFICSSSFFLLPFIVQIPSPCPDPSPFSLSRSLFAGSCTFGFSAPPSSPPLPPSHACALHPHKFSA